jgi:hypothetical protein
MLLKELNSEFGLLFEDLSTAGSKGLDDYERSICFTVAQERIITALASQKNLSEIQDLVVFNIETNDSPSPYMNSVQYNSLNESLLDLDFSISSINKDIPAVRVPMLVIDNMKGTAYQYPPKDLAYVVVGESTYIVFPPLYFDVIKFTTRYVKTPTPVILSALDNGDSIKGISNPTEPVLKDSYQDELVDGAVKYAIAAYIGVPEKEVQNDGTGNKQ